MESEKKLKIEGDDHCKASVELLCPTPGRNKDEAIIIDSDSPLTISTPFDEDIMEFSPRTPDGCLVFDPFAPGPDNLMLAPRVQKFLTESKFKVARRLNFGSSNDGVKEICKEEDVIMQEEEEEVLLDKMYKSLLDVIVVKQIEGLVVVHEEEEDSSCGFETPPKCSLLSGVADTCSAAPRKAQPDGMEKIEGKKLGLDFKRIDMGMCRKLNFDDEDGTDS